MPKINVTRSSMPSYEEYCEEIRSIWDTVHLTNMGPKHNELKEKIKEYLRVENVELFVNGHLALYVAIKALNLKGEIITTPFTFASTTNAIVQAGCAPVYCDIKPDYTIDESKIEGLITEKTSAILAVHVYGNVCNVAAIQKIADKYNLKVIYDSAHAFGVLYDGIAIGNYGDVNMFSFHATKVFHTIEGGCLTFKDKAIEKEIVIQRNFGISGEELLDFGINAKMNEFQAAMGICNLRHIDAELALRKKVFERYTENLVEVKGISILRFDAKVQQNYAYYPILIDSDIYGETRDALCLRFGKAGIFARKYFYPLVSENKAFGKDMAENTPLAMDYSRRILCLPMYSALSLSDVDEICNTIKNHKKQF